MFAKFIFPLAELVKQSRNTGLYKSKKYSSLFKGNQIIKKYFLYNFPADN